MIINNILTGFISIIGLNLFSEAIEFLFIIKNPGHNKF